MNGLDSILNFLKIGGLVWNVNGRNRYIRLKPTKNNIVLGDQFPQRTQYNTIVFTIFIGYCHDSSWYVVCKALAPKGLYTLYLTSTIMNQFHRS